MVLRESLCPDKIEVAISLGFEFGGCLAAVARLSECDKSFWHEIQMDRRLRLQSLVDLIRISTCCFS